MKLVEVCFRLKNANSAVDRDLVFSDFFHSIKNDYDSGILEGFSFADLDSLDTHSKCHVLAIYEHICFELGITCSEDFKFYEGVSCPLEENVIYLALSDSLGKEGAVEICLEWLENSIEPFRSRGIIAQEFNYAV